MRHAQTIAMARGLLADGRADDVVRMLEPLLEPLRTAGAAAEPGQVMLRTLLARIRLHRYGDAQGALELLAPFSRHKEREELTPEVQAEVALWLGWAYAWEDAATYDAARALHLLDAAERRFREDLDPAGRCWALLGQARAYGSIDEFSLMHQALEGAAALHEQLRDAQAAVWINDLRAAAARERGHYTQALAYVDTLKALGERHREPLTIGRAHAHRAVLYDDLGRAPGVVVEAAAAAVSMLSQPGIRAGHPLLAAFRVQVGALLRSGAWEEAERVADRALTATRDLPAAAPVFQLACTRLDLRRGLYEKAQERIDRMLEHRDLQQHRLLTGEITLVQGMLFARQGAPERGRAWVERAYLAARETGSSAYQLQVLLALADISLQQGDLPAVQAYLRDAERFDGHFSLLPLAAHRLLLTGRLAALKGEIEEAQACLTQARSAYTLIGDVYHTALVQLEAARLGCRTDVPSSLNVRPLLDAAVRTFRELGAHPECEAAQALLDTCPSAPAAVSEVFETSVGLSLARSALSTELVAEAWLQSMEHFLPGRWMGVYRCEEGGSWTRIHEHGATPQQLRFPSPEEVESFVDGFCWMRLRAHPGPALAAGVALAGRDDPAWQAAYTRLKPWLPAATLALDRALQRAERLEPSRRLSSTEEAPVSIEHFVCTSPAMRTVTGLIRRIRSSHSPVLITGESGTGKERIARALHAASERRAAPFVAFNCAAVPRAFVEHHLFGARPDGSSETAGALRAAEGGTLFLDEIGALPPDVQPKLLRLLQEGEVCPLDGRRPVQMNVRVIAATHQDLEANIRAGRFREDLYYRLRMVPLHVPPLRRRREDIPLLVRHFLDRLRPPGVPLPTVTDRAMKALLHYAWPGNVRQLRNEIERALVYISSEPAPMLDLHHLSPAVSAAASAAGAQDAPQHQILLPDRSLETVLGEIERRLIEQVLAEYDGQVTASAEALGLTRQGLYKKMKRLGIDSTRLQNRSESRDGVLQLNGVESE